VNNLMNGSIPTEFSLSQNYPNPFNPSTTIRFSIPIHGLVSLRVIDMLGKEVATLVSEEMAAGTFTISWNASSLASGVYFYRLQCGSFLETKKLVVLR
jgi:hypothetical protein